MRSKVTREQADVFHEFLDARSIPRKCHMCGHPYSTAHHRAIVGLTDAHNPNRDVRLLAVTCSNCGNSQFFDPEVVGISI
jgi:predicted nucleic-acid-binding Zn-ribbon protein